MLTASVLAPLPLSTIHPHAERPLTAMEKKMIKAMASLTPTQKRWLCQYVQLYVFYRDSHVDQTHVHFWTYMHHVVQMFVHHWCPGMWPVWRWQLQRYWKRCIQETVIRYYDWMTGRTQGLKKLKHNWYPTTPPLSLMGCRSEATLSIPMFCADSPTRPSVGRGGKRFEALFAD
ncbi:hypothetical protein Moror_10155 [Moniliophthora roreri MCA 2997]|uniref:Uncharacterized protein n=1 Tax=Moniliophthora roreri (strain MCA 2997) TaxID=1381753 RepID=V2XY98_MONRO|nr:hypothetical protein Moror_10155 [Moniliophthora roreri MCA 2997]